MRDGEETSDKLLIPRNLFLKRLLSIIYAVENILTELNVYLSLKINFGIRIMFSREKVFPLELLIESMKEFKEQT